MSEAGEIRKQLGEARKCIFILGNPERSAVGLNEAQEIADMLDRLENDILFSLNGTSVLMDICNQFSMELTTLRKNLHINTSDAIALGNCSAPKGCLALVRTWH